jgi:hypothetical protein
MIFSSFCSAAFRVLEVIIGHVSVKRLRLHLSPWADLDKSLSRPPLTTLESLCVKLPVLKLNAEPRMMIRSVSS